MNSDWSINYMHFSQVLAEAKRITVSRMAAQVGVGIVMWLCFFLDQ